MCVRVRACVRACVCVCVWVNVCVFCMYVYMYMYVLVHARVHMCACMQGNELQNGRNIFGKRKSKSVHIKNGV